MTGKKPPKLKPSGRVCVVRIPRDYRGDYSQAEDQSTALGMTVDMRTASLVAEIGGGRHVGIVKRQLARNFTIVGVLIEGTASGITELKPVDIGALSQLMNAQIGLARVLGTDVATQQVSTVSEWVRAKNAKAAAQTGSKADSTSDEPAELSG